MATHLPFFSYSLEGYTEAKKYLRNREISTECLRGFSLIEYANDLKEAEDSTERAELLSAAG